MNSSGDRSPKEKKPARTNGFGRPTGDDTNASETRQPDSAAEFIEIATKMHGGKE